MIKAVATINKVHGTERKMGAKVTIDGTKLELLHEFLGIFDSLEDVCPGVIVTALQMYMEDK